MKDSFWYELYKASSEAIPAHLLQVVTHKDASKDPVARVPSPIIHIPPVPIQELPSALELRQRYGIQVQDLSHGIMGMNLRFPEDGAGGAAQSRIRTRINDLPRRFEVTSPVTTSAPIFNTRTSSEELGLVSDEDGDI